ncbi:hypothetical protein DFH09DRAFT_1285797 [Mycena vulgaris]|nr:hypothetical protein DFH09DRAFT_1285797 [Mycena vulgaris]
MCIRPRIHASLDRTHDGWNHHKIRTEKKNKTPGAIDELSRERAIVRGYWTGDLSGDLEIVANHLLCGYDGEAPLPPAGESSDDAASATQGEPAGVDVEVPQAQAQVELSHLPSLSSGMGISLHGDERGKEEMDFTTKKDGKSLTHLKQVYLGRVERLKSKQRLFDENEVRKQVASFPISMCCVILGKYSQAVTRVNFGNTFRGIWPIDTCFPRVFIRQQVSKSIPQWPPENELYTRFLPDARKSSRLKIFKSSRLAPFKTRARNQDRIKTPSFKTTLNTQDSSKSQAACKSISYSSLSSVSDVMSAFPPFWPPCSFNARGEDVVMITVALPCIYGPG